jgi:hypothetical protein
MRECVYHVDYIVLRIDDVAKHVIGRCSRGLTLRLLT